MGRLFAYFILEKYFTKLSNTIGIQNKFSASFTLLQDLADWIMLLRGSSLYSLLRALSFGFLFPKIVKAGWHLG